MKDFMNNIFAVITKTKTRKACLAIMVCVIGYFAWKSFTSVDLIAREGTSFYTLHGEVPEEMIMGAVYSYSANNPACSRKRSSYNTGTSYNEYRRVAFTKEIEVINGHWELVLPYELDNACEYSLYSIVLKRKHKVGKDSDLLIVFPWCSRLKKFCLESQPLILTCEYAWGSRLGNERINCTPLSPNESLDNISGIPYLHTKNGEGNNVHEISFEFSNTLEDATKPIRSGHRYNCDCP